MANVTITLPVDVLDRIDDLVDQDNTLSRSKLIREAIQKYIRAI
jgi:metal-responsive CopG/Arc/MetJ family transcriptional regulator